MMIRNRWMTGTLAAAVLTAGLSACSDDGAGSASGSCSDLDDPVKIAQVLPLSGPAAQFGEGWRAQQQVAIDYFNKTDTVCGQKFELHAFDDKGDPNESLSIGREIVASDDMIVTNDSFGAASRVLHPLLMKAGVVVMNNTGPLANTEPTESPTGFGYGPDNSLYAQASVDWAVEKGYKKIGIMSDGTEHSLEIVDLLEEDLAEAGLTSMATVTYSPTAVDVTPQLTQQRDKGVDTLILAGYTGLAPLFGGLNQMGWEPNLIGTVGAIIASLDPSDVPAQVVDACHTYLEQGKSLADQPILTEQNVELLDAMEKAGGITSYSSGIVIAYNALVILKEAVETAGTLDAEKLAAAIESMTDVPGTLPGMRISFSADNHVGFPQANLTMCSAERGEHGINYRAE